LARNRADTSDDLTRVLSTFSLFSDLTPPQLEAMAHTFEEAWFNTGDRILREGFAQPDVYIIIQGEAEVRVEGQDRARLTRGDFFGEISALLGDLPSADVVALSSLRCLVATADEFKDLLIAHPNFMFRMLQTEARRLKDAIQWRS
jgi:CRP/FNR family transcriptional regulator, cyclic AMP receptor protein